MSVQNTSEVYIVRREKTDEGELFQFLFSISPNGYVSLFLAEMGDVAEIPNVKMTAVPANSLNQLSGRSRYEVPEASSLNVIEVDTNFDPEKITQSKTEWMTRETLQEKRAQQIISTKPVDSPSEEEMTERRVYSPYDLLLTQVIYRYLANP